MVIAAVYSMPWYSPVVYSMPWYSPAVYSMPWYSPASVTPSERVYNCHSTQENNIGGSRRRCNNNNYGYITWSTNHSSLIK